MNLALRFILLIFFIFSSHAIFSQTAQTIRTGRPGVSIGPYVVGTNILQLQSGLTYDQFRGQSHLEAYTFDNVIRYGINESFELSGVINYSHTDLDTNNLSGVSNTQFGGRVNLIDDPNGFIKALCVQFRFKFPWESPDYESDDL